MKKAMSILLSFCLIISLLPVSVFAGDEESIKSDIELSAGTVGGKNGLYVSWYLTSGSVEVLDVALSFSYDASVFYLADSTGAEVSLQTTFKDVSEHQTVTYSQFDFGNYMYAVVKGGTGTIAFSRGSFNNNPVFAEKTMVAQCFLAYQSGKSAADVTKDALRLATYEEADSVNQDAVIAIANDDDDFYYGSNGGKNDTAGWASNITFGKDFDFVKPALKGSVSITGTAKIGQTLTANASITSTEPGTLSYQWYRGDEAITGAAGSTYTLTAADVGKTIKVTVTAENYSGSLSSDPTSPVADRTVESLSITTPPAKTEYVEGERFDSAGMVVTATFDDATTAPVTGYAVTPDPLVAGQAVKVSYGGKETTVAGITILKQTTAGCFDIVLPGNPTYDGTAKSAAVTVKSGVTGMGTVTVKYNGATTAPVNAGTYKVTIDVAKGAGYAAASLDAGSFTIQKATPVITVDASKSVVKDAATSLGAAIDPSSLPLSYKSADPSKVTVNASGEVTGLVLTEAPVNVTVSFAGNDNYNSASQTVAVTVTDKIPVAVTFADAASKDYTGSAYKLGEQFAAATVDGGKTLTGYKYGGKTYADLDALKAAEVTNAGTYTVTAFYETATEYGEKSASFTINKADQAALSITSAANMQYKQTLTLAVAGGSGTGAVTYEVANGTGSATLSGNELTATGVGKVTVKATKAGDQNHNPTTASLTITIEKAAALKDIVKEISLKYSAAGEYTLGSDVMPGDAGALTYSKIYGQTIEDVPKNFTDWSVDANSGKVTWNMTGLKAGDKLTLVVGIDSANYDKTNAYLRITVTDKDSPVVQAKDITVTYNGAEIPASAITGTAKFGDADVPGSWSWKATAPKDVADSSDSVTVVFTPTDTDNFAAVEDTIKVTINKADPTGAPGYTAITASGKTLADAALTVGSIEPAGGTIAWDLGDSQTVAANTAYNWTYTPSDTANYNNLTGSITPYVVSSGGGGGGSTAYAVTVESAENGAVTSSHKTASKGTVVTLTVTPDEGYELSTLTVTDGSGSKVSVTEKSGKYTFTMPASKVTVKAAFAAVESETPFADVADDAYYADAVIWASEEGVTGGTSTTTFSPNASCTRAQAVTFLWRAAGSPAPKSSEMNFVDVAADAYYHDAVLWAVEQGITAGTSETTFSPDATCTRAQIVTFLWRAQGSPDAGKVNPFTDVAADAYYNSAVLWAVESGITAGTSATTFGPDNTCTRAQIVTFLWRALGE